MGKGAAPATRWVARGSPTLLGTREALSGTDDSGEMMPLSSWGGESLLL